MTTIDTSDMLLVHGVFRDGFAGLPDLIGAARDERRVEFVAGWARTLLAFLRAHHEAEDALVWPKVLERSPADAALVRELEGQHEHLVELLDRVEDALRAWDHGHPATGGELASAVEELDAALRAHLDQEEEFGLPVIAARLTAPEWGELPGHAMRSLAADRPWLVLGLVRDRMTPDQRDAMLAHLPPPVAAMWHNVGESAYKSFMAELGI